MSFAELLIAGRWLIGIVLIVAAAGKLSAAGRESTVEALRNYRALPPSMDRPVAVMLPLVEIGLACLLLTGVAVTIAAACTAALLGTFAAVVGWHVLHGRRFGCGCGRADRISWTLAGRDAALGVLAILVAFRPSRGLAVWPGWDATPSSAPALHLVPIPLLVVLVMIAVRLLQEAAFAFRAEAVLIPKEKF
jgi:uncharacterized membrane protein YphA (DoxX/SURF4 family)